MARQLTPEQLQLSLQRKLKKATAAQAKQSSSLDTVTPSSSSSLRTKFLERPWLKIRDCNQGRTSLKIATWNLLAQKLVRESSSFTIFYFPNHKYMRRLGVPRSQVETSFRPVTV